MGRQAREVAIGGAAALLGAGVLVLIPVEIPGETIAAIGDMRSPAFFPALAAIVVLAAGAAILLGSGLAASSDREALPLRPWVTMAAALAGAATIPLAGIYAGLLVTMLAVGAVLRTRPLPLLAIVAGTIAGVHLVFARIMKVVFPDPGLPLPPWWPH